MAIKKRSKNSESVAKSVNSDGVSLSIFPSVYLISPHHISSHLISSHLISLYVFHQKLFLVVSLPKPNQKIVNLSSLV